MSDSPSLSATPPSPPAPDFPSGAPGSSGGATGSASATLARSSQGASLRTDHGVTTIASSVVAKIAGLATQEIPGVQAMGRPLSRTVGAIRSKVPGGGTAATTQGVSVEVGERQAAIDIDIVAYYGQSIVETASAIRDNVMDRISSMTGLEVVEVNVNVDDLYIGSDGENQESRVE